MENTITNKLTLILTIYDYIPAEIDRWKEIYLVSLTKGIDFHWLIGNQNLSRLQFNFVNEKDLFIGGKKLDKFSLIYKHIFGKNVNTEYFKVVGLVDHILIDELEKIIYPKFTSIIRTRFYEVPSNLNLNSFEEIKEYLNSNQSQYETTHSTYNTILPTDSFFGDFEIDYNRQYFNLFEDQLLALFAFANGYETFESNSAFYLFKGTNRFSDKVNIIKNHLNEFEGAIDFWFLLIDKIGHYPDNTAIDSFLSDLPRISLFYSENTGDFFEDSIIKKITSIQDKYKDRSQKQKQGRALIKKINELYRFKYPSYLNSPINKNNIFIDSFQSNIPDGELYYAIKWLLNNTELTINIFSKAPFDPVDYFEIDDITCYKRIKISNQWDDYCYLLATSKYLLNDVCFHNIFVKRPEQIYINTWHGTALKMIGAGFEKEATNRNINNLKRDFKFINGFFSNNSYMESLYISKFNIDKNKIIRSPSLKSPGINYNNDNRRVLFLYTWPESNELSNDELMSKFCKKIQKLDKLLRKSENNKIKYYLKPHKKIVANQKLIELSNKLSKIFILFNSKETTQLIMESDIIITDFSSFVFDSLNLNKKVILDFSDIVNSKLSREIYFDTLNEIKEFTIVCKNHKKIVDSIFNHENNDLSISDKFRKKYFTYDKFKKDPWVNNLFANEKTDIHMHNVLYLESLEQLDNIETQINSKKLDFIVTNLSNKNKSTYKNVLYLDKIKYLDLKKSMEIIKNFSLSFNCLSIHPVIKRQLIETVEWEIKNKLNLVDHINLFIIKNGKIIDVLF